MSEIETGDAETPLAPRKRTRPNWFRIFYEGIWDYYEGMWDHPWRWRYVLLLLVVLAHLPR